MMNYLVIIPIGIILSMAIISIFGVIIQWLINKTTDDVKVQYKKKVNMSNH